ncbi:MAG TPA: tripartite tricarboxylate transporter substrate binding protein [Burkholderiales bacterium]|nr:tripartite tricarboxylate transporter substrate binding protein [Burkholderiales bacterium]
MAELRFWSVLACVLSGMLMSPPAQAQQWPERPIHVVVPYAPGGTIDIIARQLSSEMERSLGKPVIVDNRAGAGGIVGTEYVARQPADGYTILLTTVSHTLTPSLQKLQFDPENSFDPIVHIADSPQVLFRNPSFPAATLRELIELARKKPGALNYAHGGIGSPANIAMELLKSMAQIDVVGVAFKGAGPVVTAVVGGQVDLGVASLPAVQAFITANSVKALGVSTGTRTSTLPDVPTFAEEGVTGYEFNTWFGFLAPKGTPPAVTERLVRATNEALRSPAMRESLKKQGADPVGGTSAEFSQLLKVEFARWPDALRRAGIKGEM